MKIEQVAVIGAGTMGASIAMALAANNYRVILKDVSQEFVDAGLSRIDKMIESRKKKGLSDADAQQQREAITGATTYDGFDKVDLVIEAVLEKIEIKRAVFNELDKRTPKHCILATNTSGLSITQIASFTQRPEKVLGLHFFNPAHIMKLVEVIPGLETSEETVQQCMEFVRSLGKLAVRVEECASFLVNRLLGRYMNEALYCLQEGTASIEEIDKAVCDYVMPIGPFALRDMNGADIGLAVAKFNYQEYGERFRPAPVLEAMVDQKLLGQKTGKGFYLYDPETKKRTAPNAEVEGLATRFKNGSGTENFNVERLFLAMINEAFLVLQEKVCAPEDIDPALEAGLGMRKGPLKLAQEMGLEQTLQKIEHLFEAHGERFRPAPLLKRYVWGGKSAVVT
jgi:3-hydroxyacyl-CoA dehydrogenase / enoyl-CoA hydratase / 3-hydroxybutyryl-CoA epimerase